MAGNDLAFHFVCTRDEARKIINKHRQFWVSNCGCRENKGKCNRSRIDVCLYFRDDITNFGSSFHKAKKSEVNEILQEAKDKYLVTRPFRDEKNMRRTGGICFCCDDCCEYFVKPGQKCDKGKFIERTNRSKCSNCGTCVDVCYFKARDINDKLKINRRKCYGCGLCIDVCPSKCIEMKRRR